MQQGVRGVAGEGMGENTSRCTAWTQGLRLRAPRQEAVRRPPVRQEQPPHQRRLPLGAFAALTASPGATAHHRRRREHGDWHAAAPRLLLNRFLGQLHHCLKTRQFVDEQRAFAPMALISEASSAQTWSGPLSACRSPACPVRSGCPAQLGGETDGGLLPGSLPDQTSLAAARSQTSELSPSAFSTRAVTTTGFRPRHHRWQRCG